MNIRYGLFKLWLKFIINECNILSGMWLTISITTRCPNKCEYCPLGQPHPIINESSLEQWKNFIEDSPSYISYVCISGGEPSLVSWFPDFINWLIDSGRTVTIYSMLQCPERFLLINNSWRLFIDATFHKSDNRNRFINAYNIIKRAGFNIEVFELDNERKQLDLSRLKHFYSQQDIINTRLFHCAPNAPMTKIIYQGSECWYRENLCGKS